MIGGARGGAGATHARARHRAAAAGAGAESAWWARHGAGAGAGAGARTVLCVGSALICFSGDLVGLQRGGAPAREEVGWARPSRGEGDTTATLEAVRYTGEGGFEFVLVFFFGFSSLLLLFRPCVMRRGCLGSGRGSG